MIQKSNIFVFSPARSDHLQVTRTVPSYRGSKPFGWAPSKPWDGPKKMRRRSKSPVLWASSVSSKNIHVWCFFLFKKSSKLTTFCFMFFLILNSDVFQLSQAPGRRARGPAEGLDAHPAGYLGLQGLLQENGRASRCKPKNPVRAVGCCWNIFEKNMIEHW